MDQGNDEEQRETAPDPTSDPRADSQPASPPIESAENAESSKPPETAAAAQPVAGLAPLTEAPADRTPAWGADQLAAALEESRRPAPGGPVDVAGAARWYANQSDGTFDPPAPPEKGREYRSEAEILSRLEALDASDGETPDQDAANAPQTQTDVPNTFAGATVDSIPGAVSPADPDSAADADSAARADSAASDAVASADGALPSQQPDGPVDSAAQDHATALDPNVPAAGATDGESTLTPPDTETASQQQALARLAALDATDGEQTSLALSVEPAPVEPPDDQHPPTADTHDAGSPDAGWLANQQQLSFGTDAEPAPPAPEPNLAERLNIVDGTDTSGPESANGQHDATLTAQAATTWASPDPVSSDTQRGLSPSDHTPADGLHTDWHTPDETDEEISEPVDHGPRWYRRQISNYGPLLGLIPMALFGAIAWALQYFSNDGNLAAISLGLGAVSAPLLMVAGLPFGSSEAYRFAALASILVWLLIGWWATRRTLAKPLPTWRKYFIQLLWLTAAMLIGVVGAYTISLLVLR